MGGQLSPMGNWGRGFLRRNDNNMILSVHVFWGDFFVLMVTVMKQFLVVGFERETYYIVSVINS